MFKEFDLAFDSVLIMWMNLEPIIKSEVSQKEKNKYCVLMYIYETKKMVLVNLFAEQQWRFRYKEETCGQWGKERVAADTMAMHLTGMRARGVSPGSPAHPPTSHWCPSGSTHHAFHAGWGPGCGPALRGMAVAQAAASNH